MSGYAFAVAACIGLIAFLVVLLRTRRLREKYAVIWIVVGLGLVVLGAFPGTMGTLARAVGVQTPSNLLFAVALIVLLLVCIQLSIEITSLEEESRTLVEEVALLRFDVERMAPDGAARTVGSTSAGDGTAVPARDEVAQPHEAGRSSSARIPRSDVDAPPENSRAAQKQAP